MEPALLKNQGILRRTFAIVALGLVAITGTASLPAGVGAQTTATPPSYRGEILWDRYGIPHIYGADQASVFYGFGWAQARNHGDLILKLFGEARGRSAEYWGGSANVDSDKWVVGNGVPARAIIWYRQQTPQFRASLDAFANGINAYAKENPDKIAPAMRQVLPITGVDVVAHAHKLTNFSYVAPASRVYGETAGPASGSNAWAVAPSRSASGRTMLLANPHLGWPESQLTYMEAHLNGPGIHMYGATQVALPVLRFMFNERMGMTNTVNNQLASTVYELTLKDGGYLYDGAVRAFETSNATIKVRQADGSVKGEIMALRQSVHGPVFTRRDGKTVALRVAGLDRPGFLQQYWDMARSKSHTEFLTAMRRLQIPTFNIVYADRAGHIAYIHNGAMPKRGPGDLAFWRGLVPGNSSSNLWTDIHPFADLPQVIDPASGFVQNANEPPWIATWPQTIRAANYPAYAAPAGPMSLRAQNSVAMLIEKPKLSFEDFVSHKLSTRATMADRVLPELLEAAEAETDPQIRAAAELLKAWDRQFNADSRAALLFETWATLFAGPRFLGEENYATPWQANAPITTPRGLKDRAGAVAMLKQAAAQTIERYGALDRPFGEVSRFRLRDKDVPGHGHVGGLGVFRVMTWSNMQNGTRLPVHGETWVSMVEFGPKTRALGLMSYGNASQPGTPHRTDQLDLLSANQFRNLPLHRADVEAITIERTQINPTQRLNQTQNPRKKS